MKRRSLFTACGRTLTPALAIALLAACQSGAGLIAARSDFDVLRSRYVTQVLQLHPVASMYFGASIPDESFRGINGRLRDYSPAALENEVVFFREIQRARDAIRPELLTDDERLDYVSIGRQLTYILHQLENVRYYQRSVGPYVAEPYLGISWIIQQMEPQGDGMLGTEAQWRLVVERLGGIPGYLESARTNLMAGRSVGNLPDRASVERDGIDASRANADYFRVTLPDVARRYIGGRPFGAALLPDLDRAAAAAGPAYDAFAGFLEQTYDIGALRDQVVMSETPASTPRSFAELYSLAR